MNGPGDIPLTLSSIPEPNPCSLISIIPSLGMSSCRGRAEAFARRLSSKLRTLGSQTDDGSISQEDETIINGIPSNTWLPPHDDEQAVTDLQPLRHESDSFFDFDCELESPGSPVDECEYLRLIETASNTPHNSAPESGYVCASAASSHSSADGVYLDTISTDGTSISRTKLSISELPTYVNSLKINDSPEHLSNGFDDKYLDENKHEQITKVDYNRNKDQVDHASDKTTNNKTENTLNSNTTDFFKPNNNACNDLSPSEMITIQDDIIIDLQKISANITEENLKNASENSPTEEYIESKESTVDQGTETITTIATISSVTTVTTTEENGIEIDASIVEVPQSHSNNVENNNIKSNASEIEDKPRDTEIKTVTGKKADKVNDESDQLSPEEKQKQNINLSAIDTTDDDDDDCRPQRVRRCSSLKTGKTPPGTPGRKKIVRFADVLGLDLADIKTFLDEIPTIPKSAFEDLEVLESEPPIQLGPKSDKLLMPLFQQPGGLPTFLDIVREKQVSLENAAVTDTINQTITGSVRVRNLDFNKSVHIRYSLDGWRSFADLQGNYVENSCDGFSDKFTFIIFGNSLHVGQRLEFAVRFQCKGQQYWDNNYGANYCFQCLPTSNIVPQAIQPISTTIHTHHMPSLLSPTVSDAWCSSFY